MMLESRWSGVCLALALTMAVHSAGPDAHAQVAGADGVIRTVAGSSSFDAAVGDGGPATDAFLSVGRITVAPDGKMYIWEPLFLDVRVVSGDGTIDTFVGLAPEFDFDIPPEGRPASELPVCGSIATAPAGVLYAVSCHSTIYAVSSDGVVTNYAGGGQSGNVGDGGPATEAHLIGPSGLATDSAGNVYFADSGRYRVRRVSPDGTITTIAGNGSLGYSGDGGPATSAQLELPSDVAVDGLGNVYIAEFVDYVDIDFDDPLSDIDMRIRKVSVDGTISTFAGGGSAATVEDGAFATSLNLGRIGGLEGDPFGNVYVALPEAYRVIQIDRKGLVTTVAGTGVFDDPVQTEDGLVFANGEGGYARSAQVLPIDVAVDRAGSNLYVAEPLFVRKVSFGVAPPSDTPSFRLFEFSDRGGTSMISDGAGATTGVGYGRIRRGAGSSAPSGVAIFGFRRDGVLIGEASVPATQATQGGRIYAEIQGAYNTGIAIANPNDVPATVAYHFTNSDGVNFGNGTLTMAARSQTAAFLDQAPFNSGTVAVGTFTFTSSVPVAAVALRGFTNERGEFLTTTLPMAPLGGSGSGTRILPHFADGGGWKTRVTLVNPTDEPISGTVRFLGPGQEATAAEPAPMILAGGAEGSEFAYAIPARSARVLATTGTPSTTLAGTVRVVPDEGTVAPSALAIFSYARDGVVVTESGVPAVPRTNSFRMYVEISGEAGAAGSIRSGLAVGNATSNTGTVFFTLTDLTGASVGPTRTRTLPASGQIVAFVDQLFDSLDANFTGILRVRSIGEPIVVSGLRSRVNERDDFLIATTPPTSEADPPVNTDTFFPHIADSGGWTTQFVLFSGTPGASNGDLSFFDQSGGPLGLIED